MKYILILILTLSLYSCDYNPESTVCPCTVYSINKKYEVDGRQIYAVKVNTIDYPIYEGTSDGCIGQFSFNTTHLYNIGDTIK